jgi:hypothetical protein
MNSILGEKPLSTIVRLIVLSIVVGMVLALLGLHPFELLGLVRDFVLHLYHMGFDAFGWLLQYFLLGAVIVVPIWLLNRLWRGLSGDRRS